MIAMIASEIDDYYNNDSFCCHDCNGYPPDYDDGEDDN